MAIGGATKEEAISNYITVLIKLSSNNLKLNAQKTKVFPKEFILRGWLVKNNT